MFRGIRRKPFRRRNQPTKKELGQLVKNYRTNVLNEKALELLKCEDIKNLVRISRYADMGNLQAIEAAFCLGYFTGQQESVKQHKERLSD